MIFAGSCAVYAGGALISAGGGRRVGFDRDENGFELTLVVGYVASLLTDVFDGFLVLNLRNRFILDGGARA